LVIDRQQALGKQPGAAGAVYRQGERRPCGGSSALVTAALAKGLEAASREGRGDYVKARHRELRRQVEELPGKG
jgi:hypothetical protein